MTEPTDDFAFALGLVDRPGVPPAVARELAASIAAALASERAAAVADLRARVEAVAEELEDRSTDLRDLDPVDRLLVGAQRAAAHQLRAALTDTTGDPA